MKTTALIGEQRRDAGDSTAPASPNTMFISNEDGHVNTVKHADLVLQGMGGWEHGAAEGDGGAAKAARTPRAKVRTAEPAASCVTSPDPEGRSCGVGLRRRSA